MKSSIYIDQGTTQIVLTPENEWERHALKMIAGSSGQESQTYWGNFFECEGGWYRHTTHPYCTEVRKDDSLMFRINKKNENKDLPEPSL